MQLEKKKTYVSKYKNIRQKNKIENVFQYMKKKKAYFLIKRIIYVIKYSVSFL